MEVRRWKEEIIGEWNESSENDACVGSQKYNHFDVSKIELCSSTIYSGSFGPFTASQLRPACA